MLEAPPEPATCGWRSALVMSSLLMVVLAGWPVLPDQYATEIRNYLPVLFFTPLAVIFSFVCFRSPLRGDRLVGVIGLVVAGLLVVAFILRSLYCLEVMPATI